jgi:hypothetical protein
MAILHTDIRILHKERGILHRKIGILHRKIGVLHEEIRSLTAGTKFSVMALAQNAAGKSGGEPLISAAA